MTHSVPFQSFGNVGRAFLIGKIHLYALKYEKLGKFETYKITSDTTEFNFSALYYV